MESHNIVLLLIFFISVSAFSTAQKVGEWTPIGNINDPHVLEIAQFAVTQYDKQYGKNLSLVKVLQGETKVADGTTYCLNITTSDGSTSNNYNVAVLEKPWIHFRNLTSFTPLLG